ncbi:MAG: hypothetical protein WC716_09255 [Chitinophagaceae bacterium]|jgi:hypothetical protein
MPYFLEQSKEKSARQLTNFASKLGQYKDLFNLSDTDIAGIKADAAYNMWSLVNYKRIETYKKSWTSFRETLFKGDMLNVPMENPEAPVLDPRPAVVPSGIEKRFTTMVKRVKAHQNYTRAIGQNLGIETVKVIAETLRAQPSIKLSLRGGKVIVKWKKGLQMGILIEKNTGSGFVKLDKDFNPPFVDNAPLPRNGQLERWEYRAIYLQNDELAGQWSQVAGIIVGE